MKSTGEVMGIDVDFPRAFAKSQLGAGSRLPTQGTVFLSVRDSDKRATVDIARRLVALGFKVIATSGTAAYLGERGIAVGTINKVQEGRPHCVDAMLSGQVQLVVNTTSATTQARSDSFSIRRTALVHNIPHYTTVAGARAAVGGIEALRSGTLDVAPLQSYFSGSF
jgi:carbamoyl-phosphate synthase large subunit